VKDLLRQIPSSGISSDALDAFASQVDFASTRGRSYEDASDRIAQRASKVDDEIVVDPSISIDDSPIDEDTLRRSIR
jgi:hypothetical protein